MINYENFFIYEYWRYETIRHMFSFTAAVFAASLFYLAMTVRQASEKYCATFVISGVVMVSATLEFPIPQPRTPRQATNPDHGFIY